MIDKRLILETADAMATVTLNNPEKLNALDEIPAIGFAREARHGAEGPARAFAEKRQPNFTGR